MAGVQDYTNAKLVAPNTVRYEKDGDTIWRFHLTDIIIRHADGSNTLSSGGWRTATTKKRLNQFGPVQWWQRNGEWYSGGSLFWDGMKISADGVAEPPPGGTEKARADIRKRINLFCAAIRHV